MADDRHPSTVSCHQILMKFCQLKQIRTTTKILRVANKTQNFYIQDGGRTGAICKSSFLAITR